MKINESVVHKCLLKNAKDMLKNLYVTDTEYRLYSALDLLRGDLITTGTVVGKIDLILRYKGERLITEIKYESPSNTSSDFWNSLKVLGYTEYYKWQTGYTYKVHPAVIVPIHSLKLEQQIIAGRLGLRVFGIYEENGSVKLKFLDDRPIWRQTK